MGDPGLVIMGGSNVGHYGRIQGGSSWGIQGGSSLEDPGWIIMGGSRVGNHWRIQVGPSFENPG